MLLSRELINDTDLTLTGLLRNTQGFVIEKHRRDHVWHFHLRLRNGMVNRATLCQILGRFASRLTPLAALRQEKHRIAEDLSHGRLPDLREPVVALGLSWPGYETLGKSTDGFYPDFRQGLRDRCFIVTHRSTQAWEPEWKEDSRYHCVIIVAANDTSALATEERNLRAEFGQAADILTERGSVLRGPQGTRSEHAREHFGFADGISNPVFFNDPGDRPLPRQGFDPKAPLKLVLVPEPFPALPNNDEFGSYLAYAKIEQHEDRFAQAANSLALQLNGGSSPTAAETEHAKELIVGRTRTGKPLVQHGTDDNDFHRASDPSGSAWPFSSHTAKMNSRDGRDDGARILRRGITYDADGKKGVLFLCFQANLERQFETQMRQWALVSSHPVDESGSDPMVGVCTPVPQQFLSATGSRVRTCISGLTTIRGGDYYYFPSRPSVNLLANT